MLYINNNNIIDTAFVGPTELTKIMFNGIQVWAKAIASQAWYWCDSCWDYISSQSTGIPSKALPIIQAAGGTSVTLTMVQGYYDRYLMNTNTTEKIKITIGSHSPITYAPGDTLLFVNAGSPYLIHNGVNVFGGQDKPNVYFSYANNF